MPKTTYPTIRAAVQARFAAAGITTSELERRLPRTPEDKPVVSRRMIDFYLTGQSDLSSGRLDALMAELGLVVSGK